VLEFTQHTADEWFIGANDGPAAEWQPGEASAPASGHNNRG
jgi:hypothetical protein